MQEQPQITSFQLVALFASSIIGVGILSLPREVAEIAKQDAWISVILTTVIFAISACLVVDTSRCYPGETFDVYIKKILGVLPGRALLILITLYCMMITGMEIRSFSVIIKLFVLDQTPLELIAGVTLFASYIIGRFGVVPIVYFVEAMFVPTMVGFFVLISLAYGLVDLHELRPVLEDKVKIIKAIPACGLALSGPEVLAGFVIAYLYQPAKEKVLKLTLAAYGIVLFQYTLVMIISIGAFSSDELHYIVYPTTMLLRSVEFTGGVLERLDAFFMILYIPIAFTTVLLWHYYSSFLLTKQLKFEEQRPVLLLLVPILYIIVQAVPQAPSAFKLSELISKVTLGYGIIVVPVIWLIARLRRRGNTTHEA